MAYANTFRLHVQDREVIICVLRVQGHMLQGNLHLRSYEHVSDDTMKGSSFRIQNLCSTFAYMQMQREHEQAALMLQATGSGCIGVGVTHRLISCMSTSGASL